MPDATIVEASKSFLDFGVIGALCIILMGVIVYQARTHKAEMTEEREAHQKTRENQLADLRNYATIGESVRDQMKTLTVAFEQAVEIIKDRGRS